MRFAILLLSAVAAIAQSVSITELSHVPQSDYGSVSGNVTGSDIWTYRDAQGIPYALTTSSAGLVVFNLQDPANPVRVGEVPGAFSLWQDVKTYTYPDGRTFAFLITETARSGIQVIDLSDLPNSVSLADNYAGIDQAHNIFIHPQATKPYAYVVVAGGPNSGVHVVDISDPTNLTNAGYWSDFSGHDVYVHDEWYDPAWDGKDVMIAWTEQFNISVVDVTDKTNPTTISTIVYPQLSYSHSGWMDRTNRYLFAFDEGDEQTYDVNTTMRVLDMSNLSSPGVLATWRGPTAAIDHNGFVMGDYVYLGNYTRGFTLIDVHDPANPVEAGYYDTWPASDAATFNGVWAGMPYLADGLVAVSDFNTGFYVLQVDFKADPAKTNTYYVPLNTSDAAGAGYLRVINPGGAAVEVDIIPVNDRGVGTMHAKRRIEAGGMLYQPLADMFTSTTATYNWIQVNSSVPLAVSLEGIGEDTAVAIPAVDHLATQLSIPHIAADTGSFFTKANVVNGFENAVDVTIRTADGGDFPLNVNGSLTGEYLDFETLFGGSIGADRTVATAFASEGANATAALVGSEVFGGKAVAQTAGLTLTDVTSTSLTFAHIASVDNGWWTGIAAVNPNDATAQITIRVRDAAGMVVAQEDKTLAPGGKLLDFVNDGNRGTALISTGIPTSAVWLEITSDIPLTGYELFSDRDLRLFAGLQAGTAPAPNLALPFGGNEAWYAGVAVVNPSETAQQVRFERISTTGTVLQTAEEEVAAGARFITTAENLFGGRINEQSWIRVSSDGDGIHGFVLYGPFETSWLCGVGGIPITQ